MKILAIETATMLGGVAVMDSGEGLLASSVARVRAGHSERLMADIDLALKRSGLVLGDIDALAVSVGPGSFTGLRIGLATAKGLAFDGRLKVVAVPTLEAFALRLAFSPYPICPMLDARKGEVYAGVFQVGPEGAARLVPEASIKAGELALRLADHGRVVFAGEGAALYRAEVVAAMGGRALFAPPHLNAPSPEAVAALGLKMALAGEFSDPASLSPFYIRKSEAEIKNP